MTARLAAAVLVLEAVMVFFATVVAATLLPGSDGYSAGSVWAVGLGLALLCVLVGALVRRPGGIALGSAVQVLLIATGVFVPAMFVVGAGFAALWVWLVSVGRRIDADRRRWAREAGARPGGG